MFLSGRYYRTVFISFSSTQGASRIRCFGISLAYRPAHRRLNADGHDEGFADRSPSVTYLRAFVLSRHATYICLPENWPGAWPSHEADYTDEVNYGVPRMGFEAGTVPLTAVARHARADAAGLPGN